MAVGPKFVTSRSIMDCTFILIGPNNKAVILASNAGGSTLGQSSGIANIQSTSILFDDRAPGGKLKYSATQEEATNIYIPN